MSDYTPSTDNVRLHYARPQEPTPSEVQEARGAEFDRWLAEIQAQALREAADYWPAGSEKVSRGFVRSWLNQRADRLTATTEERPNGSCLSCGRRCEPGECVATTEEPTT